MKKIQVIRVKNVDGQDADAGLLADIRRTLEIESVTRVRTCRVFRLEGLDGKSANAFAHLALCEEVNQRFAHGCPILFGARRVVEVAYKPGVMNPEIASIRKVARDLGLSLTAADTSIEYAFDGTPTDEEIERIVGRLLVNKTVQRVVSEEPETLLMRGSPGKIETVPIRRLGDDPLMDVSKTRELHLNLSEMRIVRRHFEELEREPTDGEIEMLAQTWSEHCQHKTFKARLFVDDVEKTPLMDRIKQVSAEFGDQVISSFHHDNSGVIRFYDGWAICGKVETHNSPSALDPYGGAATGSGGVFRDILGTGQGAEVVLSTDMFCLAPWALPVSEIPTGCLSPDYLLRNVVRGVRDYGNRMGIPTANGSLHFHYDFRAKPTVIVGAYGIMPERYAHKGTPRPGDRVIAIGGRTGRDGIHGATFSSGEMTHQTVRVNAAAVQIGNAIEEKRMADALIACRDAGLVRAVTDCGAGGFASAIGEMGSETGVRIYLERAPVKYEGLAPWEIWLSESQERMVFAVTPEHVERVLTICQDLNVEATELGEFTDTHRLLVVHDGEVLCDLDMEFLHHGLPQRIMVATKPPEPMQVTSCRVMLEWEELFCRVLAHPDVASKAPIVRQYDHGVQGTNALPPFGGELRDGPNDAVVLRLFADKPYGLMVAHGMNPILNRLDPYRGTTWAIAEALANFVAVGGNPREAAFIDNFIWPFPDAESLWALDRSVDACCDAARILKIPFVSGKDSLSSTYRGKDGTVIKIPPVTCISVFGRIPDVGKTISSDFKIHGRNSVIAVVGLPNPVSMGGTIFEAVHGMASNECAECITPSFLYFGLEHLFQAIQTGKILACHDVSEGGIAVALAEMCFGGDCGAVIDVAKIRFDVGLDRFRDEPERKLFAETAGTFLIEVADEDWPDVRALLYGNGRAIGRTWAGEQTILIRDGDKTLCQLDVEKLYRAWADPFKEVFA